MDYTNSRVREIIDDYIHDQLHRDILKSRLIDGETFEQLAEHYDMSDRQMRRIIAKLQDEVFRHI